METSRGSTEGRGALSEASNIDNSAALLLSFPCGPCGGCLLSASSLVHPWWLRYVGGGCSVWVLTHEEYTDTKKDLQRSLRTDKHWKEKGRKKRDEDNLVHEKDWGRRKAKGMRTEGGHYSIKRPQAGAESTLTSAPSSLGSLAGRRQRTRQQLPQASFAKVWVPAPQWGSLVWDIYKISRWQHK